MTSKIFTNDAGMWDVREAEFSLFAPGINRPEGQRPYRQGTLKDAYTWMNSVQMIQLTRELRTLPDEKQQKSFKLERLPYATFSGTFCYRRKEQLIRHSGLQCFDFDHLGGADEVNRVKEKLLHDPYFTTELMFTSPRGNGVKWVTHIDLRRGNHDKWYPTVCNYLRQTYALQADTATSNVASACFLCFDENMYCNPLIAPF